MYDKKLNVRQQKFSSLFPQQWQQQQWQQWQQWQQQQFKELEARCSRLKIRSTKFKQFLKHRFDDFAYFYHRYQLPRLNYTICTGGSEDLKGQGDLKKLHEHFLPKTFWHGQSFGDLSTLKSVLKKPLWQVMWHKLECIKRKPGAYLKIWKTKSTNSRIQIFFYQGQELVTQAH